MLKVGIIGAGGISKSHAAAYNQNPRCSLVAVADPDTARAQALADEYNISKVYSDYRELLADDTIDAVSIATPTFTHKDIAIDSIKSGKHILCEKPPAMNKGEVQECIEAMKDYNKCFMFAFVCRFRRETQYLKKYIDAGKMGDIICATGIRTSRTSANPGWFALKEKGGGIVRDVAIHDIDTYMYLMDFPKVKAVLASTSYANCSIAHKIKQNVYSPDIADNPRPRTIEDAAHGIITLENGACITLRYSSILTTPNPTYRIEINGVRAGAVIEPWNTERSLEILEITDDMYMQKATPILDNVNAFQKQIDHFADCCIDGTPCMVKPEEAMTIMEIIDAIYESAETGETIYF